MHDTGLNEKSFDRPDREKYWKELSIEEKIERMRVVVKDLMHDHGRLNDLTTQVMLEFEKHEHHEGKILLPMRTVNNDLLSRSYSPTAKRYIGNPKNPDETYF